MFLGGRGGQGSQGAGLRRGVGAPVQDLRGARVCHWCHWGGVGAGRQGFLPGSLGWRVKGVMPFTNPKITYSSLSVTNQSSTDHICNAPFKFIVTVAKCSVAPNSHTGPLCVYLAHVIQECPCEVSVLDVVQQRHLRYVLNSDQRCKSSRIPFVVCSFGEEVKERVKLLPLLFEGPVDVVIKDLAHGLVRVAKVVGDPNELHNVHGRDVLHRGASHLGATLG